MATQNNDPDPTTTVPHDETTPAEAGGRTADPKKAAPQEQPEGGTTVPHDDA